MKSQKASIPKSDPPAVLLSSSDPAHLQGKMQEVHLASKRPLLRRDSPDALPSKGARQPRAGSLRPSAGFGGSCGCFRAFPSRTRSAEGTVPK